MKLDLCSRCRGFLPPDEAACPHCGAARSKARVVKLLGGALGGGAIAFTLMACYGGPVCPDGQSTCHGTPPDTSGMPVPTAPGPDGGK